MRVAILSESQADEAALRILVDAALGVRTVVPTGPSLRSRGWPYVRDTFRTVALALHFRTAADGLVMVADSNHASVIEDHSKNRLRELQNLADSIRREMKPVSGHPPLQIAVGVASPAIEAWLLCKNRAEVSEATWEKGLLEKRDPYTKLALKKQLYGVERPSLNMMTQHMVEAAQIASLELPLLEARFPNGFGSMLAELRKWRTLT